MSGSSLDFRWPYTYQMNASVQRQVTRDVSVSAAYVGSLGRSLPFTHDLNYPIFGPGAASANVDTAGRFFPAGSGPSRWSIDHEYVVSRTPVHWRKKNVAGISLKGLLHLQQEPGGDAAAERYDCRRRGGHEQSRLEKGRDGQRPAAQFRDVDGLAAQLSVQQGNPIGKALANGWTVSAIASARSGNPFTVTAGRDVNLDGTNNDRPHLIGNPVLDPNRSRSQVAAMWFNTAAFILPAEWSGRKCRAQHPGWARTEECRPGTLP